MLLCVEDGLSPQGLIKHQFLESPETGGSFRAVAGHARFLHVLLNPEAVPINVI